MAKGGLVEWWVVRRRKERKAGLGTPTPGLYFVQCHPAVGAPPLPSRTASSTWESLGVRFLSLQRAPLVWRVVAWCTQPHQGCGSPMTAINAQNGRSQSSHLTTDVTLFWYQQRWGTSGSPVTLAGTDKNYSTLGEKFRAFANRTSSRISQACRLRPQTLGR